ncbi:monocarboxylate transporter 12-like [Scylla paramamosain]|uniref:monocarboxylate transporter 12-like n=1 Tax=Scylla paramamosain TaxID=85552 RepID=UPI003082C841
MKWTLRRGGEGDRNTTDKDKTGALKDGGGKLPYLYTEEGKDHKEGEEEDEAPDGGWGWVVAFGCFMVWAILGSASAIFGVLFAEFLTETRTSSTVTAWIHNLAFVLSCYCTFLLDPLVEEYGWRQVTMVMGLMRSAGLAVSAFAPNAYFLFFSYTIFAGIPIDVLYSLSFSVIPHYFTRRRTIANTFMSMGSSVSMLAFPLFVTFLQNNIGFKAAIIITAALNLNLCVAAMVFHPVEWHSKKRQCQPNIDNMKTNTGSPSQKNDKNDAKKMKAQVDAPVKEEKRRGIFSNVLKSFTRVGDIAKTNLKLMKCPRVVIVSLVASINLLGLSNFDYLVPFAIQAAGHSLNQAGLCFTLAGVCLLITRLLHPFLVTCMTHKAIIVCGSTLLATSVVVFAWADDLLVKAAMMGAFGSGTGLVFASYNLVMVEVLGLAMLQPTLSITGLFNGALFLVIGPFIGLVRDLSGSYKVGMSVLSVLLYTSVLLWVFLPAAVTEQRSEERNNQQQSPPTPSPKSLDEKRPLLFRRLH